MSRRPRNIWPKWWWKPKRRERVMRETELPQAVRRELGLNDNERKESKDARS